MLALLRCGCELDEWPLTFRNTVVPLSPKVKHCTGARGSAVGWGTALQAGRSRVRFPMVSLWPYGPWVDSASNRNEYQEYFLGVKAAGAWGWHPYHLHVPTVLKSRSLNHLEPSGPVQACNGIALSFTKHCKKLILDLEDEGSTILRNVKSHLPKETQSHPRRTGSQTSVAM